MNTASQAQQSTSYLSLATVFVISLILYIVSRPNRRVKECLDKIPGAISLPIIGSSFWFIRPTHELMPLINHWHKQYKTMFKFWIGNQGYVTLTSGVEAEKILSSTIHTEKSTDYELLHKWLGFGLLTAKPNKWHGRRKLLTPTFHFKILEEFTPIFNEQGNILVDVLKNKTNGQSFDIFPYITRCALDIICETAMGKKMNAQRGQPLEYVKSVYEYGDILLKKMLLPWLRVEWVWNLMGYGKLERNYLSILHNFTECVISARKFERNQEKLGQDQTLSGDAVSDELLPKQRKAFLDLLLDLAETDKSLTDYEVRTEVDTFAFEGHDTTAANMAWTIFLLSFYPEYQKKVQEELDEIFGNDRTRDITPADISKMKWLSLCIKESLRLYPSVPFYIRFLNQDADFGNGKIIAKGTNVAISSFSIHRDPEVFPDPETFNPERFLPENCVGRSPYAYIPFSAGGRNCIGQRFAMLEEKIVLAKLVLHFNLESTAKKREDVKMLPDIILRPMGGIHVKLTARK